MRSAAAAGVGVGKSRPEITVDKSPLWPDACNVAQPEAVHRLVRLLRGCGVVVHVRVIGRAVRRRHLALWTRGFRRPRYKRVDAGAVGEAQLPTHRVRHEVVFRLGFCDLLGSNAAPFSKVQDLDEAGVDGVAWCAKATPQAHSTFRSALQPVTPSLQGCWHRI